jgi:hypothetical protein
MPTTRHRLPSVAALRSWLTAELRDRLRAGRPRVSSYLARLRDPRMINPAYVFAAGLGVMVPIWLIFLNH